MIMNKNLTEESLKKILQEGKVGFSYDLEVEDNIMESISTLSKPTFSAAYAKAIKGIYVCLGLSILTMVIIAWNLLATSDINVTDDLPEKFLPTALTLMLILILFALSEFSTYFKPRNTKQDSVVSP